MFRLYLNQQTAASNAWTFYVCTWRAHTNTTSILSYLFSHSVELPLGFTGVVLYLHHLRETVTFTQNKLDTVRMTVHRSNSSACTLLWLFDVSESFCFFHLLLSKAAYVYDCVQIKHTPFTFHQRYGQLLSQKSFQYLKITLLLHGPSHACSHSTSQQVVWLASQPMKENDIV